MTADYEELLPIEEMMKHIQSFLLLLLPTGDDNNDLWPIYKSSFYRTGG
jgi:hypothetical protein